MGLVLFKPGVVLRPDSAGVRILGTLDRLARAWRFDVTVTCGSEGHPPTDPHTLGRAFDVRVHDYTDSQKTYLLEQALLDLRDGAFDATETLTIPGIWLARANQRWFGQIEAHGEADEHLHLQLRKGVTWPPPAPTTNGPDRT